MMIVEGLELKEKNGNEKKKFRKFHIIPFILSYFGEFFKLQLSSQAI